MTGENDLPCVLRKSEKQWEETRKEVGNSTIGPIGLNRFIHMMREEWKIKEFDLSVNDRMWWWKKMEFSYK